MFSPLRRSKIYPSRFTNRDSSETPVKWVGTRDPNQRHPKVGGPPGRSRGQDWRNSRPSVTSIGNTSGVGTGVTPTTEETPSERWKHSTPSNTLQTYLIYSGTRTGSRKTLVSFPESAVGGKSADAHSRSLWLLRS